MFNFCQDCDSLQTKTVGTAPERPQFQQATKYDHYGNFQRFKQSKEEESLINKRKEELLKFNPEFTDFQLNPVLRKEKFEELSTQDIAKCRQQLRSDSCHHQVHLDTNQIEENCNDDSEDSENENKSLKKRKSLLALTRTPVQCPISVCNRTIGVTFVLSHYLRDHNADFGVPCQEIYDGKRSILIFDPAILNYRENVCLGILAYGGDANESSSRPSERGICINNAFLPKPYEHLTTHLPILIMACRTSWSALLENKYKENSLHNPNYMNQELLVIWLVSAQTVKPIHCTVTLYDKSMTSSRSSIMQIRDLNETQIPQEFMLKETNFIPLSHGEESLKKYISATAPSIHQTGTIRISNISLKSVGRLHRLAETNTGTRDFYKIRKLNLPFVYW